MIVHTDYNVHYLPRPNRVEIILTDVIAPIELAHTAFVMPMFDDESFLLAVHQRRGIEIPGGHREDGESLIDAAVREAYEEVGAKVVGIRPVGHLKMISDGIAPEGWRYPHPLSYQQVFFGEIEQVDSYIANEECAEPFRCYDLNDRRITRKAVSFFGEAARLISRSA